ncbi:MAG TPA: DNA adenine methylase [Planctomycetaceae bacterium]|nr:DNA adenine methylase [Planctomycetaceae bacterium]
MAVILQHRDRTPARAIPAFLNWAGSKRRVSKFLLQETMPIFQTYHEPFLGSGANFLALATVNKISHAHLADKNEHIVSTFLGVKKEPEAVIRALNLHVLLDSDVHFASATRRLNRNGYTSDALAEHAADMIYALAQSFHSSWYETREGKISLSRRPSEKSFKPKLNGVCSASALLRKAEITRADFKESMLRVMPDDLVFIDPPYLSQTDSSDSRAYTAERFSRDDLKTLLTAMDRVISAGGHVVFCWSSRLEASLFKSGEWTSVGRDYVWTSFGKSCLNLHTTQYGSSK